MGFLKCGSWLLRNGQLACDLKEHGQDQNVLYAFVCNGEVVYIGKTTQSLKKRMYGYLKPGPTQSTNIKGNEQIQAALEAEKLLEIYTLPDNGLLYYGGFHVNLAAGLEDSLLKQLQPVWNRSGKGTSSQLQKADM